MINKNYERDRKELKRLENVEWLVRDYRDTIDKLDYLQTENMLTRDSFDPPARKRLHK